ncbi:MAG: methyltransferase domain-containing protein [Proteobacteria bacterium]|nr:methyltransferase domain-containing protein [Pseudomonadota bacterium]
METQFKPNWTLLESLRNRFLSEEFSPTTSYWSTEEVLEQYHSTFAERIGWKWDAVLRDFETKLSQSSIVPKALLDWGCGTGIAALKLAEKFYRRGLEEIVLWDRSPASIRFSMKVIQNQFPLLKVRAWDCQEVPKDFVLVCSHILNELSSEAEKELKRIIDLSQWVFWVEPGTPEHSRKLIELRESLRSHFTVVAPCPHQLSCGLLDHSQKNNWCHFFAPPPAQVFQSSFWREFSLKLKIDLRSRIKAISLGR